MRLPFIKIFGAIAGRMSIVIEFISRHPYATISLVGLIISLPLILFGVPSVSDDAVWHAFRFDYFSQQLSSGEVYPRWLNNINGGLGGPTFFFYQPLFYYITSLFRPLPISVFHQMGLTASLGIVASGIAAFMWLKEITAERSALLGAIFFIFLPYPVGHDIYVRGAFPESLTFVWMPLLLFFSVRISRGSVLSIIGMAVSFGLLLLSHLPVALILSVIVIGYSLVQSSGKKRLHCLAATIGAMILGVGLSAAYLLPAMTSQSYVFINEWKEGQFFFGGWLMTRELAIFGSMRYFWMAFEVGLVSVACFVTGFVFLPTTHRRELTFWMAALISSGFMMLYISYPIWEAVTPLQTLQFPWRFNTIISIAALPLIAFGVTAIKRAGTLGVIPLAIILLYYGFHWGSDFVRIAEDSYHSPAQWKIEFDAKLNRLAQDLHASWPRTVPNGVYDLDKSLAKIPNSGSERVKAYIVSGAGTVTVANWKPRYIELRIVSTTGAGVNVSQFFYPGWQARIKDVPENLPIRPSPDLGLVNITVPPGNHTVKLTLEKLWPEFIGEWLSGICVLITLLLLLALWRFPKYRIDANARSDLPDQAA